MHRPIAAIAVVLSIVAAGCASTSDNCRAPVGDRALTPAVAAVSEGRVGEPVTWGGTLVSARNRVDATDLEVLAYPLSDCGRPLIDEPARGRFIIRSPGYLETAELRPGRSITASGRIIDSVEGRIGDAAYRFPVVEDSRPTVWPARDRGYASDRARVRPWISVGVGGGRGWSGGGVGVWF